MAALPQLSRRALCLASLAVSAGACSRTRGEEPAGEPSSNRNEPSATQPPASLTTLELATVTDMSEAERGGTAVVLLHGWGASGDDLVSLAHRLARPRSRFFMPAGPLAKGPNGRAWWHLDTAARPPYASSDETPPGYVPHPEVLSARANVQTLLRNVRSRYAPQTLVLAGFSQGAMLSLDVALTGEPPVDKVAVLSGVLMAESLAGLRVPRAKLPRVFVSHGRRDSVLSFQGAEQERDLLAKHGFTVLFHPFDGGHEIPFDVVEALGSFVYAS